jgi:uncharacterized protein (DUF1330 family)
LPLVEQRGGELAGNSHKSLRVVEGTWEPSLLLIHRWPGAGAFRAFYDSTEYQPLKRMRRQATDSQIVLLNGTSCRGSS